MFARFTARAAEFPGLFDDYVPHGGTAIRINLNEFSYKKGNEIFGEKEPADYVYQVVSGAVRSYKLLSDGRRQIGAFHLAGDIFGLEIGTDHRFTAEAIVDTSVRLLKRRSLELAAENDVTVARNLLRMTTNNLRHAEDHMLLLGRKAAPEKMATFLLDMAQRLSKDDENFDLPMTRADIADHLGLTIETVSRTLTQFARSGLIRLLPAGRSIGLCNKMALRGLDA